jgi:hypothetical protein
MGEWADYYADEAMVDFWAQQMEDRMSHELKNRVARYSVSDEEIKVMVFEVSGKELCLLADKVITEKYPAEKYDSAEMIKVIDIAAWGLANKHLTQKQKWNLAGFIIFYSKGEMNK